jgi:hypothetical protein
MDPVFDAQYLAMKDSFARQGIQIDIAYTPAGEVDYMYVVGRLLALDRDDNIQRLENLLTGVRRVGEPDQPGIGDLVVLSIEDVHGGFLTVPQALDLLDERLGEDNPVHSGGLPLATPIHIVHITKICPAGEPEVPGCCPHPCPRPADPVAGEDDVRLGVCDTGLLQDVDLALCPWLAGVTGETDSLGPVLPNGLPSIPQYAGHGTFIAGVARCMAPGATVYVSNHFTMSGGELEYVIIQKLEQLISDFSPNLISLSAGTYTRNNWASLSFSDFHTRHGDIVLVAAAGNDSTWRPFYPAAFDWTVSVGALGADEQHRAWFSNYGGWVDVYALGEGVVNAYATGVYTYQEPPKRPAQQTFRGMARWQGTSFSTPLVAGLIVAEMARTGADAETAAQAVLALARSQAISGVGPAVFPARGECCSGGSSRLPGDRLSWWF